DLLPAQVIHLINASPEIQGILPAPGSQAFGLTAAILAGVLVMPCLLMLDVTRKLAGRRLRRLQDLADAEVIDPTTTPAVIVSEAPIRTPQDAPAIHAHRRPDRRTAADTLADAGRRKPFRIGD